MDTLKNTIRELEAVSPDEARMSFRSSSYHPSREELIRMMNLVSGVIFPGSKQLVEEDVMEIFFILRQQIFNVLALEDGLAAAEAKAKADTLAHSAVITLPEVRRLLLTDVDALVHNDPAGSNSHEVVFSYPGIYVMVRYRFAHELYKLGVPIIPRIITEQAHSATGIDIHPAARIGEYFAIDHGTGVVVGATSIIGNHVMLYQGVTLGARNFSYGSDGTPLDIPRHPILEDNVTIFSNTSILGRITIGHDTIIGGNVWLTHDVPPHSKILQGRAEYTTRQNGKWIPYAVNGDFI